MSFTRMIRTVDTHSGIQMGVIAGLVRHRAGGSVVDPEGLLPNGHMVADIWASQPAAKVDGL